MFSSPASVQQRADRLVSRAQELMDRSHGQLDPDAAISRVLDEGTHDVLTSVDRSLLDRVQIVDAAQHPDTSNAGIAKQLNGGAGITAEDIRTAVAPASPKFHAMLRELLVAQSDLYSTHRMAEECGKVQQIVAAAAARSKIPNTNIYYFIASEGTSFGMVAMAHRKATGTAPDRYFNSPAEIQQRHLGTDSMIVIVDDVAGSGVTLSGAVGKVRATSFKGKIEVVPLISGPRATSLFNERPNGVTHMNQDVSFEPARFMRDLELTDFYRNLDPRQQGEIMDLVGDPGFGNTGLAVALPYMAPDNNHAFFANQIAHHFIANKNRDPKAAKTNEKWAPP